MFNPFDFKELKMSIWKYKRSVNRRMKAHSAGSFHFEWKTRMELLEHFFFYTVTSTLIGLYVGLVTAFFGMGLLYLNAFRNAHLLYLIPFLGFAGLVIMSVNMRFGGKAQRGMGLVFDVGLGAEDKIPLRMVPLTIISTWMTHLFGGSAGREGVAVQIGATISMQIAVLRPRGTKYHVIVTSGMAAGFAGLFGTPIAATFFALEVLVVGSVYYEALVPALIAAYVSSFTARAVGLPAMAMPIGDVPAMDVHFMIITIVAGIIFGMVGWMFSWLLNHLRLYFAILISDPRLRIFIIGCMLAVIFLFVGQGRYSGLSDEIFNAAFTGGDIYFRDWFLKLLLTAITLAAGFQGGELTPLFVVGATLGAFFGAQMGLPVALFAAMGCVAVFGSATRTLFAPIFIGVEVFCPQAMPFFALVAISAFFISGHYGIYPAQLFSGEEPYHIMDKIK